MKTLWERLSKENQLILLENQKEYPSTYENIIEELKNNYGWTNLTVSTSNTILNDLTAYDKDFITLLYGLFYNK
jgi:predicted transcriptional regulator